MRTLWKVDSSKGEIRAVDGAGWPGFDSENDQIFDNTHFKRAEDAMAALVKDASAGVRLSGDEVERCRAELARAEKRAAQDAVLYAKAMAAAAKFEAQPNA